MAKKGFGALAGLPSGEEDNLREHVELEQHVEAQTRGKPMKSEAEASAVPQDAASASASASSATASQPEAEAAGKTASAEGEPQAASDAAKPPADAPEATAAAEDDPEKLDTDRLMMDLLHQIGNPVDRAEREKQAAAQPQAQAQGLPAADPAGRAGRKGEAPGAGGPQGAAGVVQQVAAAHAGASVAEVAGRMVAGVVAAPFLALSSAHRHLSAKASALGAQATAQSTGLKASAAAAPIASIEMITNWKCEKIEDAASEVLRTAKNLRDLDAFPVWEDAMLREANKRQVLPQDIVRQMRNDAELAPLREQMNSLRRDNPKAVDDFRRASDAYEKHIKDIVKKYPNSDEAIQKRVLETMDTVRDNVSDLPGFGKEEGEYTATLVERIAELARMLAELVAKLFARLTGRTAESTPGLSG